MVSSAGVFSACSGWTLETVVHNQILAGDCQGVTPLHHRTGKIGRASLALHCDNVTTGLERSRGRIQHVMAMMQSDDRTQSVWCLFAGLRGMAASFRELDSESASGHVAGYLHFEVLLEEVRA